VDDDPRYVLFVQVHEAAPGAHPFFPGTEMSFLIHSPQQLFGKDAELAIGKTYDFSVVKVANSLTNPYRGISAIMALPFDTDRPVLDVRMIGDKFIVILDYMTFPKDSPALNMSALDAQGQVLWTTPSHTAMSTDGWVNFNSVDPLKVGNFAGFNAVIDPDTGHILETEFTK